MVLLMSSSGTNGRSSDMPLLRVHLVIFFASLGSLLIHHRSPPRLLRTLRSFRDNHHTLDLLLLRDSLDDTLWKSTRSTPDETLASQLPLNYEGLSHHFGTYSGKKKDTGFFDHPFLLWNLHGLFVDPNQLLGRP